MEKKFIELFREAIEREDNIDLNDKFRDYPEWNSLAYLSVISMIDEEFDIVIEGNDFKLLNTVGDIISDINKRIS
ncbi:MAG: acyl carrier protein [Rikenellaceae bacterium]